MKYIYTMKRWTHIVLLLILGTACQDEFEEITTADDIPDTNTAVSGITTLLSNNTAFNGAIDDFIDFSPCFSIQFPYQVSVDNTIITLSSSNDYAVVENAIQASGYDELEIIFPITIIYSDYTVINVADESTYEDLQEECEEDVFMNGSPQDCLEFNYPITVNVFDASNNQLAAVTLVNDESFFDFLDDLEDNQLYALEYPLVVTINGGSLTLNNDDELEELLEECIEDDNDDNDEIEVLFDEDEFIIESFINNGVDETSDFTNFTLEFENDDNSIEVENDVNPPVTDITGSYILTTNQNTSLQLTFENSALFDRLETTYRVISYTEYRIVLRDESNVDTRLVLFIDD